MSDFPSIENAQNIEYLKALLKLCIDEDANEVDFQETLWISDPFECVEMFESTFGIIPYNHNFTLFRTHPSEHATKIFDYISKPETDVTNTLFWIAMSIYIIRANISSANPINLDIDEEFYTKIFKPLVTDIDISDLSNNDKFKSIITERIIHLGPKIDEISFSLTFSNSSLRTVSCSSYKSPYRYK